LKNILLGITGSVGVIEIHQYIQRLKEEYQCSISVITTQSAKEFINVETLKYFIDGELYENLFDKEKEHTVPHVHLTEKADLFLIIPCTANVIGKVANGISDDLLTTSILASNCPVVFVPNVNHIVKTRKIYQKNIQTLKNEGFFVLESDEVGIKLSSGKSISGVMPNPYNLITMLEEVILD
jgi:phosphopantothenoylcysteine synthetase/decarboxylase